MSDLISRQMALDAFSLSEKTRKYGGDHSGYDTRMLYEIQDTLENLPAVQPATSCSEIPNGSDDTISRQAAIDLFPDDDLEYDTKGGYVAPHLARQMICELPSVQPERTCVNCGRTANNGGWYADGRTRCPIEERYALPKDGYCHLWEKRNITDDDYPERRTDE